MTFKVTSTAFGWKAISSILPQFREQATFEITQEGIVFKLLDASRNSYMNMEWNKDKFKSFNVEGEFSYNNIQLTDLADLTDQLFDQRVTDFLIFVKVSTLSERAALLTQASVSEESCA